MKYARDTGNVLATMLIALAIAAPPAFAFNSGSTGADGAFNPTVNIQVDLPPAGIFHYTSVNIPAGVTVTYKRNTTNTPVVILASGNVTVAGTIHINGNASTNVGAAGNGNLGDDGIPGTGGPGGYDGGVGGASGNKPGGFGLGPGGGGGGNIISQAGPTGGGGAGYAVTGGPNLEWVQGYVANYGNTGIGGPSYGSSLLLPLVGGSGGGGGAGGASFAGSGGGGGGGAILIASSGTVSITGAIVANGATSGSSSGQGAGQVGGGGSGGAMRIVATTIAGNGTLSAVGVTAPNGYAAGSTGRIRLEAENITRTATSNPAHTFSAPGPVFVAGLPGLRITSVAGVTAPVASTGNADITLPATTTNPVTVTFETTSVPVGNTVKLTVKPANGAVTTVTSPALAGSTTLATASVNVTLPTGPSVLEATTTYTIVASLGQELSKFAQGERVEHIELSASTNGSASTTLITVSGKRYSLPASQLPKIAAAE